MFDKLTRDLLDLTSHVRGDRQSAFAMVFDCCSSCCSGCVFDCG
jgi:hypothetical protein